MKTMTFNVKADLRPFEKKLETIQAIEQELTDLMADYVAAVKELCATDIPFRFDPDNEPDYDETDIFAISPYEYPDEFEAEEFEDGAPISETPFALCDIEGLG